MLPISRMSQGVSSLRGRLSSAFTLIELLVVIGVIAIVAGVIGLGFSGGGSTVGLQSGQAVLSSLLTGARGKAAIANGNTAIFVWGDPTDADSFLRKLAVFVNVEGAIWQQNGDAVYLPQGIYVVPPDARNNSTRARLEPANSDWFVASDFDARSLAHNADGTSTGDPSILVREPGATAGSSGEALYRMITVTSLGRLSAGANGVNRIVIGPGQRESDTLIVFREPESAIGIEVSTYGIPIIVNAKESFKD